MKEPIISLVKEQIKKKRISTAIKTLEENIWPQSDHYGELILLSGRFFEVKRAFNLGLVDYGQKEISTNQIRQALLDLAHSLENEDLVSIQLEGEGENRSLEKGRLEPESEQDKIGDFRKEENKSIVQNVRKGCDVCHGSGFEKREVETLQGKINKIDICRRCGGKGFWD